MNFLAISSGKFFFILIILGLFVRCESNKTEQGTGKVNLSVLEPIEADEDISGIIISIKKIELKGSDGWITYKEFETPFQVNLLESEGNLNHFLGEKKLPAGKYDEARLVLESNYNDQNDITITSGGFLQYNNGDVKPVHIPSDSNNAISAKGNFDLAADGVINISLKFDVREGIKDTDDSEIYLLKPQINMVVNNDSGLIEGTFEENKNYKNIVVIAYPATVPSKAGILTKILSNKNQKTASATSISSESGKFILSFLKPGNYDLYFYTNENEDNPKLLLGKLEDIEIEAGQKTIVNVPKEVLID